MLLHPTPLQFELFCEYELCYLYMFLCLLYSSSILQYDDHDITSFFLIWLQSTNYERKLLSHYAQVNSERGLIGVVFYFLSHVSFELF